MVIVGISGLLEFWQEKTAADAVGNLVALVQVKATVLRDGHAVEIPIEQVVPGEVSAPRPESKLLRHNDAIKATGTACRARIDQVDGPHTGLSRDV